MNEVQKYWRDKLMSLLFFGGGFLFVVGGWSINEGHNFTLLQKMPWRAKLQNSTVQ